MKKTPQIPVSDPPELRRSTRKVPQREEEPMFEGMFPEEAGADSDTSEEEDVQQMSSQECKRLKEVERTKQRGIMPNVQCQ